MYFGKMQRKMESAQRKSSAKLKKDWKQLKQEVKDDWPHIKKYAKEKAVAAGKKGYAFLKKVNDVSIDRKPMSRIGKRAFK